MADLMKFCWQYLTDLTKSVNLSNFCYWCKSDKKLDQTCRQNCTSEMRCYGPVRSKASFFSLNEMTWLGSQKVDEHGKINEFDETFGKVVNKFMKAKR